MRRLAAALCVALLAGCSAIEFAYNNADTWLRWQAAGYVALEDTQAAEFDRRLASFLAWHRAEALPRYALLAAEAAARLERGATREDMEWGYDALSGEARAGLRRAAAELGGLLGRLTADQVARIEQRLAEDNRRFARRWLEGTAAERRARRAGRVAEFLRDWLGDLDDAQLDRVRRYSDAAPLSGERRAAERNRQQGAFLGLLRTGAAADRFGEWAEAWAPMRAAPEFIDLLAELERTLSAGQRAHVIARLRGYGRDFQVLAAAR